MECFYIVRVLSGQLSVEQAGRTSFAKAGDLVVYDSERPTVVTHEQSGRVGFLILVAPKSSFRATKSPHDHFSNVAVPQKRLLQPMLACLDQLATGMRDHSTDEMAALFRASLSLLPVAIGSFTEGNDGPEPDMSQVRRDILNFVNTNIENTDLSPPYLAAQFGVTDRYVHRMCARAGTTFGTYVKHRRLEHVVRDLMGEANIPVALVAYRWGFTDLATFNRAFKDRFGCAPRDFRKRHA
jgi:AraC-like DNA-binding protein